MLDPVMCADGQTYERAAIEKWLETHDTSPTTNAKLKHKNLIPNFALRSAIAAALGTDVVERQEADAKAALQQMRGQQQERAQQQQQPNNCSTCGASPPDGGNEHDNVCETCHQPVCDDCMVLQSWGTVDGQFCPACDPGDPGDPMAELQQEQQQPEQPAEQQQQQQEAEAEAEEEAYSGFGVMGISSDGDEDDLDFCDTIQEATICFENALSEGLYARVIIFNADGYNPEYDNMDTVAIIRQHPESDDSGSDGMPELVSCSSSSEDEDDDAQQQPEDLELGNRLQGGRHSERIRSRSRSKSPLAARRHPSMDEPDLQDLIDEDIDYSSAVAVHAAISRQAVAADRRQLQRYITQLLEALQLGDQPRALLFILWYMGLSALAMTHLHFLYFYIMVSMVMTAGIAVNYLMVY